MGDNISLKVAITIVTVILLIIISIVSLLFFIYWKRKQFSLPNLDKNHKESEENSYSSSKNSRDSSPKGGDSFNPVYDEIKLKVSSHLKESVINKENYNLCNDADELDDPHYSTVNDHPEADDEHNKEAEVCCGSVHACTKPSNNSNKTRMSCEEVRDQSHDNMSIKCTNNDIDKGKSERFETHTYAAVDVKKKKTKDMNVDEPNCTQQACSLGGDGGTPPPVPPHTPEMLLNDSDTNKRHGERLSVEQ